MRALVRLKFLAALAAALLVATACVPPPAQNGYDSLFIGHSFFRPFAEAMADHAPNAGFTDHTQDVVFSGGATGAPEALWNNTSKRTEIQAILDQGDVDLFGMTIHGDYPTTTGYENWIDYALAQNPDTKFFVAFPWLPYPSTMDSTTYANEWMDAYTTGGYGLIDDLRAMYPGTNIYLIPYGGAGALLYNRYDAGQLPDVTAVTGNASSSIFTDNLGHAGDILKELGALVWLDAIYDVDLATYDYDHGYNANLTGWATYIMNNNDPAYNDPTRTTP